jgi:ABC-type bacteriocin/lantibiotic exporter with double-glycine peptidase domain
VAGATDATSSSSIDEAGRVNATPRRSMITLSRKVLRLLDRREKRRLRLLFAAVVLTSFIEVIGISSIMPLIAVIADPTLIERNRLLQTLSAAIAIRDPRIFTIVLGAGAFGLLVLSNALLAVVNWRLMSFTYGLGHSISSRLLAHYMSRSYQSFVAARVSDAKKNVLDEAVQIVNTATVPFMQALARIPVVVLIVAAVLAVDPLLAPAVLLLFGTMYLLIYRIVRKRLATVGVARVRANEERFRTTHEALDALIEIKLLGKESRYQQRYDAASSRFAEAQALSMTLAMTPRYLFEILAFGGILLILIYMLVMRQSLADALPLVTLYAIAGYRMMPALQLIFAGFAKARFAEPGLDLLAEALGEQAPPAPLAAADSATRGAPLSDRIELRAVSFGFGEQPDGVVSSISFDIRARTVVGLAGPTGSGKTTIAHLLMGILEPRSGHITIDGTLLDRATLAAWQRGIGYVPQQIYLADASVKENIALGEPVEAIDMRRVEAAAKLADIHEFILNELPERYSTVVGERGARLSGGQRQRIVIARALYHEPELLVFDEATSALDTTTEEAVMDAINRLAAQKTIIVIAHRLNTLRKADKIIVVSHGSIVDQGKLEELIERGALRGLKALA